MTPILFALASGSIVELGVVALIALGVWAVIAFVCRRVGAPQDVINLVGILALIVVGIFVLRFLGSLVGVI